MKECTECEEDAVEGKTKCPLHLEASRKSTMDKKHYNNEHE